MTKKENSLLAKVFLLPLSKIYGMATSVRNHMFELGMLKQHEFDVPVICVGNISVGGTGKTPHTEYLIAALKDRYNIAVLSRGYKRTTSGYVEATSHSTPHDIGDEAYQIYHKFGRKIVVAVCEDRVKGIERILKTNPGVNLIILDDAFQHRYVKPTISILLTEYQHPYYEDTMMPYGRLRESAKNVSRADIVVVTKCPEGIKPMDFRIFEKNLNLIPAQSLYYSRFNYSRLRPIFQDYCRRPVELEKLNEDDMVLAVCGIGNPRPFVKFLKSFLPRVKVNIFADHHDYKRKDLNLILNRFNSIKASRKIIVTTEKDAVRLINNPYFPAELKPYIYYLPVYVEFFRDEKESLRDTVLKLLNDRKRITT